VLTFLILANFPSVLAIYWATNSFISIIQQYFINKKIRKEEI
jgi:membrane protein insertase Oxa1/YidC/SpoIIIJ